MNQKTQKTAFLVAVAVLALAIIALALFFVSKGPVTAKKETAVQLLEKTADAGNIFVKDINDGEMQIPQYDIPLSNYAADGFKVNDAGEMSYENAILGISFKNPPDTDVDWAQVKKSGVKFVLLRVGARHFQTGDIGVDLKFQENIEGATAAGLDIGVYFFSQAISEDEARQEAETVITQIKDYQVKYPVLIKWNYARVEDSNQVRTKDCTPEQITNAVQAFCQRIKAEGYTPGFYADKTFGYEKFDLTKLSEYDMWYTEYRSVPAFYYDFKIWEYFGEGQVPGIPVDTKVERCIALKKY